MFRSSILTAVLIGSLFVHGGDASAEGGMPPPQNVMPEFNVMGFGDVGYVSREASDEDGFAIGQGVLHLSASMSNAFTVFGEFTATARDDEYSFEVERLIVKYDFSDRYKLSAGRYHTPIGYWNTAYHHGAWLQTTVARPEAVKFGSSIVPIHFVGILLEGSLREGGLGIGYKAGFGNGRHDNIVRAGDAGDTNGDKAWMLQVSLKPQKLYGLETGLGYYNDEISLPGGETIEERTTSAYIVWINRENELILEYLASEHENRNSAATGDVDAWYAQYAYQLPQKYRAFKPYARIERTRVDDTDPLLGAFGLDYDATIIGLRWDFNPYATLKAEYRNEEFDNGGRENNFRVQLAFVLAKL